MSQFTEKPADRRKSPIGLLLLFALPIVLYVLIKRKIIPYNQRAINKRLINPLMMKFAGGPYASPAIIFHTGRKSGRAYATPVTPLPVSDGFIIALTYGDNTDWSRNVLAAGQASLQWHGETYTLTNPELRDTESVLAELPARYQRVFTIVKPQQVLKLYVATAVASR